ncbi:MAG: hypothetical protein IT245_07790 [Bacteroidia bacterium]|nr:hypothetical protein [Bacteroidia bacterium]
MALTILLVFSQVSLVAQYHTQLGLGNYGSVHSFYLNPSLNAYSAYNWQINLAGLWANANNNYLTLKLPYSIYKVPNKIPVAYQTESGNPSFDKAGLREKLNGNVKYISVSSDVYGPAFTFKSKTWHFGMFTQVSGNVRVNRVSEALAHAAFQEFDSTKGAFSLFGANSNIRPFNANGNARAVLGFNVSKDIKLDWKRHLLIGASIKKVWGFQGFHLSTDGLDYRQINSDSIVVLPTEIALIDYGNKLGHGWGVDLGATYVFHKKEFKQHGDYSKFHTRYFAKVGVALMDIGSVNYTDATFRSLKIVQETGVKLNSNYSGNSNYLGVLDSFMNEFGNLSTTTGNYRVGLPTRLVLTGDVQIRKNAFVSGTISQSLRDRDSRHARYQSFLMVSPRLEYRFFEVSLPILLEYDYRALRMGTSFRFGPLYAGTNSLLSFINTRSVKDADIFIGIAFGNLTEFSFKKQAKKKLQKSKRNKTKCFNF